MTGCLSGHRSSICLAVEIIGIHALLEGDGTCVPVASHIGQTVGSEGAAVDVCTTGPADPPAATVDEETAAKMNAVALIAAVVI